jgi:hypothetical protein
MGRRDWDVMLVAVPGAGRRLCTQNERKDNEKEDTQG